MPDWRAPISLRHKNGTLPSPSYVFLSRWSYSTGSATLRGEGFAVVSTFLSELNPCCRFRRQILVGRLPDLGVGRLTRPKSKVQTHRSESNIVTFNPKLESKSDPSLGLIELPTPIQTFSIGSTGRTQTLFKKKKNIPNNLLFLFVL